MFISPHSLHISYKLRIGQIAAKNRFVTVKQWDFSMIIDKLNKLGSSVVVLAVVAPPKSLKTTKNRRKKSKNSKTKMSTFRLADARRTIAVQISRCDWGFFYSRWDVYSFPVIYDQWFIPCVVNRQWFFNSDSSTVIHHQWFIINDWFFQCLIHAYAFIWSFPSKKQKKKFTKWSEPFQP